MSTKTQLLGMFDEFVTEENKKTSEILMKLSNEIIKCRLDMNMTQSEFAKFLNYSQSMISKIESEEYNFTVEKLVNIFSKLDKNIEITVKPKVKHKCAVKNNLRTEYVVHYEFLTNVTSDIYRENKEVSITRKLNTIFCTESLETKYC